MYRYLSIDYFVVGMRVQGKIEELELVSRSIISGLEVDLGLGPKLREECYPHPEKRRIRIRSSMLMILFGYALSLDVDNIPLAVWDQERTPQSENSSID